MFRFVLVLLLAAPVAARADSIGVLGAQVGEVTLWRGGKTYRMVPGTPVYAVDEIQTGADGKARILFKDDSVLSIGPKSRMALSSYNVGPDGRDFDIKAVTGRFKITVAKWFLGATKGRIETPTAVAGVRGTVVWGDTDLDAVCALEGTVELTATSANKTKNLKAGDCAAKMKEGKTEAISPTPDDLKKYLAEVTIP